MANKLTLTLLFLAAITSFGISIGPVFAATPGTWNASAEFGSFELVVNASGTGIERINYSFSNWTCGPVRISGGIGITPGTPWPITGDEFSITNYLDPGRNQEMTISGSFKSATEASGTWQAVIHGTNCEGVWQAPIWQPSVDCNDYFMQLEGDELVIEVPATHIDDTYNIQCALEVAADLGIPTVKLAANTYYISQVLVADFNGTLEGTTKTSTVIEVLNQSINCDGMRAAGRVPSAIKFVSGEPRVRYMTIRASQPCMSSTPLKAILHFTGGPADEPGCENDVIFGAVDRVNLDGTAFTGGASAGVAAYAEGNTLEGCKETLLGTFKLNRSRISNTDFGVVTSMQAGAQVDINFNEFVENRIAVYIWDSNQNTTITTNNFMSGNSVSNYRYNGIRVRTLSPDAPNRTRVVIDNNDFNIASSDYLPAYAVFVEQDYPVSNISSVVSNNRFNLSKFSSGLWYWDVSNTHVSANKFAGDGDRAVHVFGTDPVSGWTITANKGLGSFDANRSDIYLDENTFECIVGAGQDAVVNDEGSDNTVLPQFD